MTEPSQSTPSSSSGVSRRHLVRAGLAAAPVVAALKSNSVLAGDHTCIRPSSFSSLAAANWKVSQGRSVNTNYECKSDVYWKSNNGRLAKDFKEAKFISDATGFKYDPDDAYRKLSIQQVLNLNGDRNDARLARYVAAAYLSARSSGDDPTRVLLTRKQCRDIWNGKGRWSPFAGATWSKEQTLAYFDAVFGRAFL